MSEEESDDVPSLSPARPEAFADGRVSYGPRLPWKWLLLGSAVLVAIFGSYFVRKEQRKEALRAQMLELHEERLTPVVERYAAFRQRLERLVMEAAEGGEPDTFARVNLAGLRSGQGLYLRVPADWTDSSERIEGAARAMSPDAITRCLGLAPMSVRGLYERGYFLTDEWLESVRDEQDMMALRVFDDQLGRHVQVDVPVVLSMMDADWFLLVVQQGETRRNDPVDVYLWDLKQDQQLLRARVQARGLLIPVRLRFGDARPARAPGTPSATSTGATDCSIASQIRSVAGEGLIDFQASDAVIEAVERRRQEASDAAEGRSLPEETVVDGPEEGEPSALGGAPVVVPGVEGGPAEGDSSSAAVAPVDDVSPELEQAGAP